MDYKYINTEYIDSISGGDPGIFIELASIFKDQVKEFHEEMLALLSAGEYHNLGLLAHKAKSSIAIMGMTELALMLKTFELQAKESRETGLYESYIARFKNDTEEAIKEIDDLINKMKNQ